MMVKTPAPPPAVQSSSSSPDEAVTGSSRASLPDNFREHRALLRRMAESLELEVQEMAEQVDTLFNVVLASTSTHVAMPVYEGVLKIAKALWQTPSSIPPASKQAEKKYCVLAKGFEYLYTHCDRLEPPPTTTRDAT